MSTASPDKGHQRPTRWRRWYLLAFAWFIVPLLILAGLELGLRAAGYGMDTAPFQVFDTDRGRVYRCNLENLYHMFSRPVNTGNIPVEFTIPESKEPGTYRIFVFGSSAAAGWIHSASFAQMLQVMLMARFPGVRFEVYNLANAGLNPWLAVGVMVLIGSVFGLFSGVLIQYFNVQPFIATLSAMFLARGLAAILSTDAEKLDKDSPIRLLGAKIKLIDGRYLVDFMGMDA